MSPTRRPGRWARAATRLWTVDALYVGIFLLLAVQTAAASAQHAHDALVLGGQGNPAWLPWTLAGTPEALAVLATLDYRHRRKALGADADVTVPRAIIVASALVLMGAQLVTAKHDALGMFAAAWPALAFLVAVALIETRPRPAAAPAGRAQPQGRHSTPGTGAVGSSASSAVPPGREDGPPVGTPDDTTGDRVEEALARLDDNARAVYSALLAADPGQTLTPAQIQAATALERDVAYRATQRLVAAELVVSPSRGRYALARIGAVA